MSPHDDETRLQDMLDCARKAVVAIEDRSREDLDTSAVLAAALERFVEVVGEAAQRVSDAKRKSVPGIPWRQIIGMRNRLIHGYAAVDHDILWNVVHDDLPALISQLEAVLGDE